MMKFGLILLAVLMLRLAVQNSLSYLIIGGKRIKLFKDPKSWDDAWNSCKEAKGVLIKHTKEYQDFLAGLESEVWINGRQAPNKVLAWRHWDGTLIKSFNWAEDSTPVRQQCLSSTSGFWDSKDCSKLKNYVCEFPFESLEDDGFELNIKTGMAYNYFETKKTYDAAAEACRNISGFLITVEDQVVFEYVQGKTERLWIGLSDKNQTLEDSINGIQNWVWESGVPYQYHQDFWMPGEPNDTTWVNTYKALEQCTEANLPSDGKYLFNDIPCDKTYPYICEVYQSPPETTNA